MPACQLPVRTCQPQTAISETERILDKLLEWSNSDEEVGSDGSVAEETDENAVKDITNVIEETSPENSLDDFDSSPLKTDITPDRKKRSPGTPSSTRNKKRTDSNYSSSPGTPSKRSKHSDKIISPVAGRYKTRSRGGNAPRKLSYQDIPHFSSDSDFESSDSCATESETETAQKKDVK